MGKRRDARMGTDPPMAFLSCPMCGAREIGRSKYRIWWFWACAECGNEWRTERDEP